MDRQNRWCTSSIAATCVVVVVALLSGCRGTEHQEAGERPPLRDPIKRMPDLVGMSYERARIHFLQAGGEVIKRKPEQSAEQPGTVIAQQPPAGERFTHAIELVVARPQDARQ